MSSGTNTISKKKRCLMLLFAIASSYAEETSERTSLENFSENLDNLEAETTVHSVLPISENENYNSYKHFKGSRPNINPIYHSGFQASQYPPQQNNPPQNNHHPNNQPSINQGHNNKKYRINGKSQYFASPSNYRIVSDPEKFHQRNSNFPPFPKFQSHSNPSSHPIRKRPENVYKLIKHFENEPVYLNKKYPGDNLKNYPRDNFSKYPGDNPKNYPGDNLKNYPGDNLKNYPGDNLKNYPGDNLKNYPGDNFSKYPGDNPKNRKPISINSNNRENSGQNVPQVRPEYEQVTNNYKPRIVPIRASNSSPQIPQFQAASVNYSGKNDYEKLANQPQLHFTTNTPVQAGTNGLPIYHSNPYDRIRSDVELIEKNPSTTPRPYNIHDFDKFFKTTRPSFSNSGEIANAPKLQNLQLPSSNLFDSYDQVFGKYSKLANQNAPVINYNPKYVAPKYDAPKYVAPKIEPEEPIPHRNVEREENSEESNENENRSVSSDEYRGNSNEDNNSNESEKNDGTRRSESQGSYENESNERNNEESEEDTGRAVDSYESDQDRSEEDHSRYYKSYSPDFEKEFQDSYNQDIPKEEYDDVNKNEDNSEERSETRTNLRREKSSKKVPRRKEEHPSRGSRSKSSGGRKNVRNSSNYGARKDNEGEGSSYEQSTRIPNEKNGESFGYKVPKNRGTKKFSEKKKENSSEKLIEGWSKKSRKNGEDEKKKVKKIGSSIVGENSPGSDPRASSYSSSLTPETGALTSSARPSIQQLPTFTYKPFDGWKSTKKSSQDVLNHPTTNIYDDIRITSPDYNSPNHQRSLSYATVHPTESQRLPHFTGI